MDTTALNTARELVGAYTSAINLFGHLQFAGLTLIGRDAIEMRDLIFAEMLTLYIQTDDDAVRHYFHEVGIGDRLLEEANIILRGEGTRRMNLLQTLATNFQKVAEGPEVGLLDTIGRPVA